MLPKGIDAMDHAVIHNMALKGAKKVCACGTCIAGYDCGHTNKRNLGLPLIGGNSICPLAKYEFKPMPDATDPLAWTKHSYDERNPSSEELWAICAECEYSTSECLKDGTVETTRNDLMLCCDCPVKAVEDKMSECAAESAFENRN